MRLGYAIAAALSHKKTNSYAIEVYIYEVGIKMYPFALLNHLSIHLNEVVTLEREAIELSNFGTSKHFVVHKPKTTCHSRNLKSYL